MTRTVNHNGRVVGDRHWSAKLTDDQVREIRARYVYGGSRGSRGGGHGLAQLAQEYGVSVSNVHKIVTYATRYSA